MGYFLETEDEWANINEDDLWIYNKLILSKKLGYVCGIAGHKVPKPGKYIVRPSMNLLGMGRHSRIEHIENTTDHFHPSEFWCEVFEGEHLSIDYFKKEPVLSVIGKRDSEKLYRWASWIKTDKAIKFPKILENLKGEYDWINCEFIDGKLIEVHFRRNPDFRFGNNIAIPVWFDEEIVYNNGLYFIEDLDYLRKGFYIDSKNK